MISNNNRNIPERSLNPPEPKLTVAGRCYHCEEDIYEGEDIWIDLEGNMIHHDCRDEDSKRFYKCNGLAENIIAEFEYEYGRDYIR